MKRSITLVLCLALMLCLFGCGKDDTTPVTPVETIPVEYASSLIYCNGSTTLRFRYEGEKWTWIDNTEFPLDDTALQRVIELLPSLADLPAVEVKDEEMESCGLTDPQRYLTISTGDETHGFDFGNQNEAGQWYMQKRGEDAVYLAPDELMQAMSVGIYDMAVLPTLPALTEDILISIGLTWNNDSGEEQHIYLLHSGDIWKMKSKDVSDTVKKMLSELENWTILRCIDYRPSDGVDVLCGLDDPLRIDFKYNNSVDAETVLSLYVGDPPESGEGYYVTFNDDTTVYTLATERLATLLSLVK